MRNACNGYAFRRVVNQIEHSIVTRTQPPFVFEANQLLTARRARIILKSGDRGCDPIMNLRGKPSEITARSREERNGIGAQRDAALLRRK